LLIRRQSVSTVAYRL